MQKEIDILLLLGGRRPATGSTTHAKLLSQRRGIPMAPEGGTWQRTISQAWHRLRSQFPQTDPKELWKDFELAYRLDGVAQLRKDYGLYKNDPAADSEIVQFLTDQKTYSDDRRHWVRLPEAMIYAFIKENGVGIIQGKLAPFIDDKRIMGELPANASQNVARVLLDVTVSDSARRKYNSSLERKIDLHVPSALQAVPLAWVIIQNMNRMTDDWQNYLLTYGITKDIFDSRRDVKHLKTSRFHIETVHQRILRHLDKVMRS